MGDWSAYLDMASAFLSLQEVPTTLWGWLDSEFFSTSVTILLAAVGGLLVKENREGNKLQRQLLRVERLTSEFEQEDALALEEGDLEPEASTADRQLQTADSGEASDGGGVATTEERLRTRHDELAPLEKPMRSPQDVLFGGGREAYKTIRTELKRIAQETNDKNTRAMLESIPLYDYRVITKVMAEAGVLNEDLANEVISALSGWTPFARRRRPVTKEGRGADSIIRELETAAKRLKAAKSLK